MRTPSRRPALPLTIVLAFLLFASSTTNAADSLSHCATIEFDGDCKPAGCSGGGTNAYVRNSHNDKLIRATVKITTKVTHKDPVTTREVKTIEAGDRAHLGCNYCSSPYVGTITSTYEVVGCRVIQ